MNAEQRGRVKEVLHAALVLSASERAAFVARTCRDDESVCAEVERLLAAHAEVRDAARSEYDRFLESWKRADADLPQVAEARRAAARLR